jgi:hypothetical protein
MGNYSAHILDVSFQNLHVDFLFCFFFVHEKENMFIF